MTVMDDSFDPRFGEAWTAPQCAGLLPMPRRLADAGARGRPVIGFALARAVAGEAELLLLAVRRGAQGRGIGRDAARSLHRRRAQAAGRRRLHLEVREEIMRLAFTSARALLWSAGAGIIIAAVTGQTYDALTLAKNARSLKHYSRNVSGLSEPPKRTYLTLLTVRPMTVTSSE